MIIAERRSSRLRRAGSFTGASFYRVGIGDPEAPQNADFALLHAPAVSVPAQMQYPVHDYVRVIGCHRFALRSEEHTSELQSESRLVYRRLLENAAAAAGSGGRGACAGGDHHTSR